jgi:hypothetical protein
MRRALAIGVVLPLTLLLCFSRSILATEVEITGATDAPGPRQLRQRARLSDAALAAGVRTDAYVLGAAWLRPSLLGEQRRLKAGVLFDFESVRHYALEHDRIKLAELCSSLGGWLQSMPARGRQVALLDPRAVEVNPAENRLVANGDTLYYPRRPATIRVVGAVNRACDLPAVAMQDARLYLKSCPRSHLADDDWIFVIQPDGRVFEQGVGLWNRSPALPLAPGALIYVPLNDVSVHGVAPDLNRSVATFLATQPLAEPEDPR